MEYNKENLVFEIDKLERLKRNYKIIQQNAQTELNNASIKAVELRGAIVCLKEMIATIDKNEQAEKAKKENKTKEKGGEKNGEGK